MALIVKSSPLHGAGVYSTAPIKKGQRVLEYTGPKITKEQCEGMYAGTEVTYLFGMDDGKTVIDGFGTAAFVNHSCDPNCETDEIRGHIWIIALKNIKAGEELTYDYNLYDGEPGEQAPCYCGTKNCRGTMFSEDEIKRQKKLQRKKAPQPANHSKRPRKKAR
ncbi:MAG TPA: SET domain-containing protein-lysine N-methyltransferase [Verrucomicrobiae bacterium]|jgi:SET domain-containing protein|nr:SET domain-containing protein-lysine N-methyltransferase [Verrucomicrobiae bacterium]